MVDAAGVNRVHVSHAFAGGPEQGGDDVLGDEQGVADGDAAVGLGVSPQECPAVRRELLGKWVALGIKYADEVQIHGG